MIRRPRTVVNSHGRREAPYLSLPNQIPGCLFWWPSYAITGLNDGDPITTWPDLGPLANNLTGSGTARPLFKTNIVNTQPAALFDGSNDVIASGANVSGLAQVFIVYQYTGGATFTGFSGLITFSGSSITDSNIIFTGSNGTINFYNNGDANRIKTYKLNGITRTDENAAMQVFGVSSSTWNLWAGKNIPIQLGQDRNDGSAGRFWTGYICDSFGFNRILLPEEELQLFRYITSTWGVASPQNSCVSLSV